MKTPDDDAAPEDDTPLLAAFDRTASVASSSRTRLTWAEWAVEHRIVLESAGKAVALFAFCFLALILLLKVLLPPIDPKDSPDVKVPRSFDDLKRLNEVLQIYKDRNYARVMGSFVAVYLFLQAYSIPGSMYLSILAGAMYGVLVALPLVCMCVATGATLCYLISALLGPALLLVNKAWRDRLDLWRERIRKQGGNMISYLIVLRIAPLPPHWVVNVVAPHLHISIPLFWISTFFGVMAVSFIHVQIGTALDQMTSPSEFHLISWRNFFGLAGVVVGVMVPVGLRYYWQQELAEVADGAVGSDGATTTGPVALLPTDDDPIHVVVHKVRNGRAQEQDVRNGDGKARRGQATVDHPGSLLVNISDDEGETEARGMAMDGGRRQGTRNGTGGMEQLEAGSPPPASPRQQPRRSQSLGQRLGEFRVVLFRGSSERRAPV